MNRTRFTEDVRPITDLKSRAGEIVDHVRKSRRPILLTRRGRGVAVLLDVEEYEELTDRAAFVEAVDGGEGRSRRGPLLRRRSHGDPRLFRAIAWPDARPGNRRSHGQDRLSVT